MSDLNEEREGPAHDAPTCPKCKGAIRLESKPPSAPVWHRYFCPKCSIGAGGYTKEEALEKWCKVCTAWKR